jgi:hypothetical protein
VPHGIRLRGVATQVLLCEIPWRNQTLFRSVSNEKTRACWKETTVNEITRDVPDPLGAMMERIAEQGRRVYDPDQLIANCVARR